VNNFDYVFCTACGGKIISRKWIELFKKTGKCLSCIEEKKKFICQKIDSI